jgi:hypothetical protein
MIDFERVWLPQIVAYARLISTGQLEDQWLGRGTPTTSVTDPDELHEQVFDDLDADSIWAENCHEVRLPPVANEAIERFLSALRNVDESDAHFLVASSAWAEVKEAAHDIIANVR